MSKCLLLSDAQGRLQALRPSLEAHGLEAVPSPVDALALIGCPLRPRTASPLRRRVERELFSIVCDLLLVQPRADGNMLPRGAAIVLRGVNARRRKRVDMGRTFDDLWTNCKQPLEEVILGFLRAESNAKTLARSGDSW